MGSHLIHHWRTVLSILGVILLAAVLADAAAAGPLPGASPDENIRRRYMPVTLTQEGWHNHAMDLLYPKFRYAFARFLFYGMRCPGRLAVGNRFSISYDSSTASISRLAAFLPQTWYSRCLFRNYISPWSATEGGALAGETMALTLNVAYNDERLMPRQPGYDLERFVVIQGPMRGRTVGQVLDVANRVLGGISPRSYGFADCDALAAVLRDINSCYEFVDYDTFYDRGYLFPDRPFGVSDPPHAPHVP